MAKILTKMAEEKKTRQLVYWVGFEDGE